MGIPTTLPVSRPTIHPVGNDLVGADALVQELSFLLQKEPRIVLHSSDWEKATPRQFISAGIKQYGQKATREVILKAIKDLISSVQVLETSLMSKFGAKKVLKNIIVKVSPEPNFGSGSILGFAPDSIRINLFNPKSKDVLIMNNLLVFRAMIHEFGHLFHNHDSSGKLIQNRFIQELQTLSTNKQVVFSAYFIKNIRFRPFFGAQIDQIQYFLLGELLAHRFMQDLIGKQKSGEMIKKMFFDFIFTYKNGVFFENAPVPYLLFSLFLAKHVILPQDIITRIENKLTLKKVPRAQVLNALKIMQEFYLSLQIGK